MVKAKALNTSTKNCYTGTRQCHSERLCDLCPKKSRLVNLVGLLLLQVLRDYHIKKLAKSYASLQESLSGVNRVFELFTIEPTIKDDPRP